MMKLSSISFIFVFVYQFISAQTYYRMDATNDGATINLTCPISNTRFADDGNNATHYSNNNDRTITFCAPIDKLLKFDFGCGSNLTIERIHSSDTLFIYDGNSIASPLLCAVTGNPGNSNRLPYFNETSSFVFLAPSNCITFRFKSSPTLNEDGWDACITCVDPISCNSNEPASDLFGAAPYICNLDGYCGTTSADFGADFPVNLNKSGGNCPSSVNFLGTVENNSWIKFIASASDVSFDFEVPLGGACLNGIQTAIFAYDGSSLTRMSPCEFSDGGNAGSFSLTATGLTIGETYYIMTDGNAGDVCDFTINANSGVLVVDAGPDQPCAVGSPIEIEAIGPAGAAYTWNSLDGTFVNQEGAIQTVNPTISTTYVVEVTNGVCLNQSDTLLVTLCSALPIELMSFGVECNDQAVQVNWSSASERNNAFYTLERANESSDFVPIGVINGGANSSTTLEYSFRDLTASVGGNYYKLSQIDFDGVKSELSQFYFSNFCTTSEDELLVVQYNQTSNSIDLTSLFSKKQHIDFMMFNANGLLVFQKSIQIVPEKNQYKLELPTQLSSGIYYLQFTSQNSTWLDKLMISTN